jgi:hypothetical protein
MADDMETVETERRHNVDLVLSHHSLGVVDVALASLGHVAVAVAAQVCGDHGVLLGKRGRHLAPASKIDGCAVDQQHWWSVAPDDTADLDSG